MGRQPALIIQLSLIIGVVLLVGIVAMLQVSETGDARGDQSGENAVGLAGANTVTCPFQVSLYGDKTQKREIEGDTYVIKAVLQGRGAILVVNGESTTALRVGESATLQSGVRVKVKSIMRTWRGKRVTFCLTPKADVSSTTNDGCGPGQQPLRYNAGPNAIIWTPAGAYSSDGTSSIWTSGKPGRCCGQGVQCAFPTGCQNDGAFMGNYSYLCATDQEKGVIFGCTEEAVEQDGQELLGNSAYCCSRYSAEYNQGNGHFHALPGQRGFGSATLDEKREVTRAGYDACTDRSDNDCDGLVDAKDPDCVPQTALHQMPIACVPGEQPAFVTREFLGMGMKEVGPWVNNPTNPDYLAWMSGRLEDAGVRSAVTRLVWSGFEPQNGTYNWGLDTVMANLTIFGIRPIADINDVPVWASTNPNSDRPGAYPPRSMDDWRDAVRQAVRHYGPAGNNQIKDWKIWNEPNGREFWRGTREQAVDMLNAAHEVIKQEDPDAKVWAPGIVYHEYNKASTDYNNPDAWVDHFIMYGRFDVFTIHIYYYDPVEMRDTVRRVRQKLDAAGKQDVPLAVTEFNVFDFSSEYCAYWNLTQTQQAQNLRRSYACIADGGAASAYWFTATDRRNFDTNIICPDNWIRTGVFTRTPAGEKLSYGALREIGIALGTASVGK